MGGCGGLNRFYEPNLALIKLVVRLLQRPASAVKYTFVQNINCGHSLETLRFAECFIIDISNLIRY